MRIVPIYATVSLGFLFLLAKFYYSFEGVRDLVWFLFNLLFAQLFALGLTVLIIASKRKAELIYK